MARMLGLLIVLNLLNHQKNASCRALLPGNGRPACHFYRWLRQFFCKPAKFGRIVLDFIENPVSLFLHTRKHMENIQKLATMRNSLLVTSDLNAVILVDTLQSEQRLVISRRGVMLSVLGTEICASEVPANMEAFVNTSIGTRKSFYEFDASADIAKSQLCITYNDVNNVVFIIGITDIEVGFAGPTEVPQAKVKTFAAKMKSSPNSGLVSPNIILIRLETAGAKKFIRFYYLPSAGLS
jgi:hypothetical protein